MRNGSEASGATIVRYGPHGCFAAAPHDMVPAQTNCAEMAIDNSQGTRYTGVATNVVVTVAQSAELWIVAPAVVGSSPIGHPFFMRIGCCCLWFGFYLLSPGGRPTVLFHKRTSTGSLGSSVQAKCQENVILKAVLVHER